MARDRSKTPEASTVLKRIADDKSPSLHCRRRWPIQARFWLEWGISPALRDRRSVAHPLRLLQRVGFDALSPIALAAKQQFEPSSPPQTTDWGLVLPRAEPISVSDNKLRPGDIQSPQKRKTQFSQMSQVKIPTRQIWENPPFAKTAKDGPPACMAAWS
jgi:hypothetical protein